MTSSKDKTYFAAAMYPLAVRQDERVHVDLELINCTVRGTGLRKDIPALEMPLGCWPPRAALPVMEPGAGDGEVECVVPTLRIWARTCDSCRS